mgnify:CR=1 FL=1
MRCKGPFAGYLSHAAFGQQGGIGKGRGDAMWVVSR